ncbi:hypothetical protein NMY22_g6184 [Coprinellus aureogranulatus]|nr:hypothetical protein NMY22_g6184 [Coprinellus aureogranulatus]
MKDYLRVLFSGITVQDQTGRVQDPWSFLFIPMLAWMIRAVDGCYRANFEDVPAQSCSTSSAIPPRFLFDRQLRWVTDRWEGLRRSVEELQNVVVDGLIAPLPPFTVTPLVNPTLSAGVSSPVQLKRLGLLPGDTMYFSAYTTFVEYANAVGTKTERSASPGGDEGPGPSKRRRKYNTHS